VNVIQTFISKLSKRITGRSTHFEIDEARFDRLQIFILEQVIRSTRRILQQAGLPEAKLKDAVGEIACEVGAIFDGCPDYYVDGIRIVPVLTFSSSEELNNVIWFGGTSWMHEYALGTVDQIFHEEREP
jgi:hypothetical protein